jgi:uncharacterized protein (TIGR03086 family)
MGDGVTRYLESLDLFGSIVDGVDADRWDDPSPCAGWSAAAVVGHVINGSRMILARAVKEPPVPPATDPAALAGTDPRAAWHLRRAEIDATVERLDAAETVDGVPGVATIDDGLGRAVIEPLVHAWDLAAATGQHLDLPEHLVAPLLADLEPLATALKTTGMFADRVPVPETAPVADRLIALVGRQP